MDRREFIRLINTAGVFAIGLPLSVTAKIDQVVSGSELSDLMEVFELGVFILIDRAGKVTIINSHPELGQGTFQSIPMLIAEELEVNLEQIEIKSSDGTARYGNQLSGGSSSISLSFESMRKVGAAAREMLLQAAANRYQVSLDDCHAADGLVFVRKESQLIQLHYGELAEDACRLPVPMNPKLKNAHDFKLIGKNIQRPDIEKKINGKALFGSDLVLPGMLYAAVLHSPVIQGKVMEIDATETKSVPGVIGVHLIERPLPHKKIECVAVTASSFYAALQGRKVLNVRWDEGGVNAISTEKYFAQLRTLTSEKGMSLSPAGDFEKSFQSSSKKIEGHYETPFLAHAPMEPENAIALVQDDRCEVWAPVQDPVWTARDVAGYLGIAVEKVKVNVPFVGGAFGRKAYHDYVLEAVCLSKKTGSAVKVIWTREDDISQGPFRPGVLNVLRAGLSDAGTVTSFEHKVISASIIDQVKFDGGLRDGQPDPWATDSGIYSFANAHISFVKATTHIPIVWWRSVYASNNIFAYESFIDELAFAARKDPLTFRKELLTGNQRAINVLNLLEEKSLWREQRSAGKGIGMALTEFAGSYCAHAVLVSKGDKEITIDRVISIMDCGLIINADNVRAQTEGNIIMGLTAAVRDGIVIENGRVRQSNFHNYRVLRINEVPQIDVHIVENEEKPGGVGETGLPPIAPALTNALFALTGIRIKKLPIDLKAIQIRG
jgi:isoquinoline 1-oxidoreductase beta subunit